MSEVMLSLRAVCKTFHAGTQAEVKALQNLTLDVEAGSFVTVIGVNGSGKSTLLNAVAGATPLDSGEIGLAGQEITHWPEHRRARLIGRVFQNPFTGTAPGLSIEENLALAARRGLLRGLGRSLTGRLRREMGERIAALNMHLEDRLRAPVGTLSGGQRQALTLLMATWQRPELLLLDEHTAALDPKSAAQVIQLTRETIKRDQLTVIMVTHSMSQAVDLGDRLIMLHHGQVLHDFAGREKKRLRPDDLLLRFEQLRRAERLEPQLLSAFREAYI